MFSFTTLVVILVLTVIAVVAAQWKGLLGLLNELKVWLLEGDEDKACETGIVIGIITLSVGFFMFLAQAISGTVVIEWAVNSNPTLDSETILLNTTEPSLLAGLTIMLSCVLVGMSWYYFHTNLSRIVSAPSWLWGKLKRKPKLPKAKAL